MVKKNEEKIYRMNNFGQNSRKTIENYANSIVDFFLFVCVLDLVEK